MKAKKAKQSSVRGDLLLLLVTRALFHLKGGGVGVGRRVVPSERHRRRRQHLRLTVAGRRVLKRLPLGSGRLVVEVDVDVTEHDLTCGWTRRTQLRVRSSALQRSSGQRGTDRHWAVRRNHPVGVRKRSTRRCTLCRSPPGCCSTHSNPLSGR
jgi:hypothetical protein